MTTSSAARFVTILRPLSTLSGTGSTPWSGNFRIFSINGNSTFDQNVRTRFINTSATKCLPKLLDIGKEQPEKDHYNTGQLIIHKIFEYRGVVLFPWRTELYDRDITRQSDAQAADDQSDDADDGQLQKQQVFLSKIYFIFLVIKKYWLAWSNITKIFFLYFCYSIGIKNQEK